MHATNVSSALLMGSRCLLPFVSDTATKNKRETTNVQAATPQPNPHHQEHAKKTPVRHRPSSSITIPFRPPSSRVGRHRASSSHENQTRIRTSVQHKPCQTHTMIQPIHATTESFSRDRCFHDACIGSSMPRRNTIAHTTTSNKRETSNLHPAPRNQINTTTSTPKHHQSVDVGHCASSSVIVPFRPPSSQSAVIAQVQDRKIKHATTPPVHHRSSLCGVVDHRSVSSIIIPCRPSWCKSKPSKLNATLKISPTQAVPNAHHNPTHERDHCVFFTC